MDSKVKELQTLIEEGQRKRLTDASEEIQAILEKYGVEFNLVAHPRGFETVVPLERILIPDWDVIVSLKISPEGEK